MQSRREFLKNAALVSGGALMDWGILEGLVQRAWAIEPAPGSTFMDAEHIVILMQENRSFDHAYGMLQGVRGFNDPRAIKLPSGNPVWAQPSAAGQSYAPFRLDIQDTKATWMGFLPHNWHSQVDARNNGAYDKWLDVKQSGKKEYADMPLTLGYYDRRDIPFYYALADAFTICDQHFCSSVTPTLPNRLYFMTGTVREKPTRESAPAVRNEQIDPNNWGTGWVTFPERLEDHGTSWKIYQNELWVKTGLSHEEGPWLSNFGTNVMEYFPQYKVQFSKTRRDYVAKIVKTLPADIEALKADGLNKTMTPVEKTAYDKKLAGMIADLKKANDELPVYTQENYDKLSPREKNLHEKAFTTNVGDPDYRSVTEITFKEGDAERTMNVPKGDVLHQFREDVKNGKLPTVSWLNAPERLSDHPESAWYGAWYISEALRILTDNPEVWKKTIFILTYDENDGYFDHVPPFVAPSPDRPETGFTSKSIDAKLDYITLKEDQDGKGRDPRESPIGLGYRVPMVVASPWSRGGCVCSQVFDNTSILQFLETFLTKKTGRELKDTNITSWRRAVCGDITSLFQAAPEVKGTNPAFVERDPFVKRIYEAQFKPVPSGFKELTPEDIALIGSDPMKSDLMPHQEPGVRRSPAIAYELYVGGALSSDKAQFTLQMEARKAQFGDRALSSPFTVYARTANGGTVVRNYAVAAGDTLADRWAISDFPGGQYHLEAYGPNGFYREFIGGADGPALEIQAAYSQSGDKKSPFTGNLEIQITNHDASRAFDVELADLSYKAESQKASVPAGGSIKLTVDTAKSHQWYDAALTFAGVENFKRRFAGRVETGKWSYTDPAMGGGVG